MKYTIVNPFHNTEVNVIVGGENKESFTELWLSLS